MDGAIRKKMSEKHLGAIVKMWPEKHWSSSLEFDSVLTLTTPSGGRLMLCSVYVADPCLDAVSSPHICSLLTVACSRGLGLSEIFLVTCHFRTDS